MTTRGDWARRAAAACSCGAIAVLAGCSSGTGSPARPAGGSVTPASSPSASQPGSSASAAAAGPLAPLTGLPVSDSVAQRPAVAVAVASPDPVGLSAADVVFEEAASPVRYLAVFQSGEASTVGPVTSTRPTDGQVLSVLHPLTSYYGGTSSFISVLDATKIIDDGYATHAAYYSAGASGLTVSTTAVTAGSTGDAPPPGLFFYRGSGASLASVKETHPTSVRIEVPGQQAQQWDFDSSTDRWVQTSGGPRVSAANLVVQIVPFKTVYLSRKYGQTSQSARVVGRGAVTIFSGTTPGGSGGTEAAGSWFKPGLAGVTNFFDAANVPMSFGVGPTWIVLAPAGTRTSQTGG
jgi:Protein of unknown function (DUF3048) N-terminal domain/Protein of unknown function (DUF3048) C-terminal domain